MQNACAIIGVIDPVITGINSTAISNLILSSHNIITEGTIQVGAGGSLELTPSLPSKFITMSLSSSTDGSGVLSATYSSGISKKSFGAKTMNASQYYIAKDKVLAEVTLPTPSGVKIEQGSSGVYTIWADRNLGATNVIKGDTGSYGDFFIWSDVTTIYSSRDWTATSQEAVLSFKPGWEDGYTVANIPYYNTTTGKCDKYNDIDGKKILDPVDDAIQVAFPGSGWRMPTYEEISALSTISKSTDSYSIMFTTSDPEPQTVWFPKAYIVNGVAYGYADANKIDGTNGLRIWSSRAAFSKGEDSSLGNDSWESRAMRFIDLSQAENGSRRYGVAVRPVIDE
ncbi:MAG: hypothetical protein Q4F39_01610 [Bacteroidia bacterium]|nr:hypothetical protein [Bacteroidia bacterium]